MTDTELDSLEKLLSGATPVPWRTFRTSMGHWRVAAPVRVTTLSGEAVLAEDARNAAVCADEGDAATIAALRNLAPALLNEITSLRAWRKEAEGLLREAADWTGRPGLAAKLYAFLDEGSGTEGK